MKRTKETAKRFFAAIMAMILVISIFRIPPEYVMAASVVSGNEMTTEVSENEIKIDLPDALDAEGQSGEQNGNSNRDPAADQSGENQENAPEGTDPNGTEPDGEQEETITVERVQKLSVVSASYRSLKLSFQPVQGASGYEIYRGLSKSDADMKLIKELPKVTDCTYTDKKIGKEYLKTGTRYYYKVRAYVLTEDNQKVYGEFSKIKSRRPQLDTPVIGKTERVNYKTLSVSYEKVPGASGYVIYRSTKKDSGFKKVGTVKKGKTLVYQDKKCGTGITYYYKVRAYRKVDGKNRYSGYSEVTKGRTKLNTPKLSNASVASADTVWLKWKKVSGANGYVIYRSESKKGTYKKVQTVKGGSITECYISGQENGKTYYYKIRAYRKVDKKNKYSSYSNIKKATFNLLASADESYTEKAQRIFGLDYYKKYSSKAEADSHMKTIGVYVWDYDLDGATKITKYRLITVHENIADTVKQIFKEIYEGPEKFPIKNLGGYSWRGDTSTSEHCCGLAIDINWEENYMIDGNVILSGKYWKPGVDPYSIPANGDVVRVMNKYGFSWGIWGNRRDYMHFSYFGT